MGFLEPTPLGEAPRGRPWITGLSIDDLDGDGLLDVVFCEGNRHEVRWLRQYPLGTYTEILLATGVDGAAHVDAADLDGDGDLDLMVASMGVIFPNPQKIGAVVLLEQVAAGAFRTHVVLERTHRVSDVQAGDLDGDGDLDLAVAQFGYDEGEIIWMENVGGWDYRPHSLLSLSGGINATIADFNGDGLADIATVVSQEWEEIYVYTNRGGGLFDGRAVFGSTWSGLRELSH